jgi:hypothetical protein
MYLGKTTMFRRTPIARFLKAVPSMWALLLLISCGLPAIGGGDATCGKDGVICTDGELSEAAGAEHILVGRSAYNADGEIIQGALVGGAVLNSGMHRQVGTTAISSIAASVLNLLSGYSRIPILSGANASFDIISTQAPTVNGSVSDCGTGITVAEMIGHCASVFDDDASWLGSIQGSSAEGNWYLVKRVHHLGTAYEVWKDGTTGLLWSDRLETVADWCDASGAHDGACDAGGGSQISLCAEDDTIPLVPNPVAADAAIDLAAKGGLHKGPSTPAVGWRLATRSDWLQADVNGIRHAVPNLYDPNPSTDYNVYWTATRNEENDAAWIYLENGTLDSRVTYEDDFSGQDIRTRCVGEELIE